MLILLSGRARVGKDTFAQMLAEELQKITGQSYIMMSYTHELKLRIQKDFDLSYEQLWSDEKEVEDKRFKKRPVINWAGATFKCGTIMEPICCWTPREIMQDYGQFFRTIDYDFWVKFLFNIIEEKEYSNVIITDGIHVNEVNAVVDKGGYHIRMEREDKDNVHNEGHMFSTALDKAYRVDFIVKNYGTLDDLRNSAKNVVKFLIDSEKILNKLGIKERKNDYRNFRPSKIWQRHLC